MFERQAQGRPQRRPRGGHPDRRRAWSSAGTCCLSGGLYVEGRIVGKVFAEPRRAGGADAGRARLRRRRGPGPGRGDLTAELVGDLFSSERVELAGKARVRGNIHYQVVEMAAGAMITGRLIHGEGETPMALLAGAAGRAS